MHKCWPILNEDSRWLALSNAVAHSTANITNELYNTTLNEYTVAVYLTMYQRMYFICRLSLSSESFALSSLERIGIAKFLHSFMLSMVVLSTCAHSEKYIDAKMF